MHNVTFFIKAFRDPPWVRWRFFSRPVSDVVIFDQGLSGPAVSDVIFLIKAFCKPRQQCDFFGSGETGKNEKYLETEENKIYVSRNRRMETGENKKYLEKKENKIYVFRKVLRNRSKQQENEKCLQTGKRQKCLETATYSQVSRVTLWCHSLVSLSTRESLVCPYLHWSHLWPHRAGMSENLNELSENSKSCCCFYYNSISSL